MKYFIVLLVLIHPFKSLADSESDDAFKHARKALLSYPVANKFRKDTEKYLFSFSPIKKENIAIIGGVGLALASGNVSTRNFNNLRVGVLGWNVTPELNFNTKSGQVFSLLSINKEF